MPQTKLFLYQDERGRIPFLDWLAELKRTDRRGLRKCLALIRRLAQYGHERRRPHADLLRDGIYELRGKEGRVNYRVLYFFHGKDVAVLAHGLTKEKEVPAADIDRAIERKKRYEQNPEKHRAKLPVPENPDNL